MNDMRRKKHTGEPGNGGEFGTHVRTEGTTVLNDLLDIPGGDDGLDLNEFELGFTEDQLSTPYARLTADGKVGVSANYYENLLWNDGFTEDELDAAYPLVEEFFKERFGAVLIGDGNGWDSVNVEFYAEFDRDEFGVAVVANEFGPRSGFDKFVRESDPGTFGAGYAYRDLRIQIDAGSFTKNRWKALREAKTIGAEAVAVSGPEVTPTDSEAVALALSLAGDDWGGPYQEEAQRLAEDGWVKNADGLLDGLEATIAGSVKKSVRDRALALIRWLNRGDEPTNN